MIRMLVERLQKALVAQGAPLRVTAGPGWATSTHSGDERIVLERSSDSYSGPMGSGRGNPRAPLTRDAGVSMRIYAQSTAPGATLQDHYERAEHIAEVALAELDAVVRKVPWLPMTVTSGTWELPEDADGAKRHSGVIYTVQITIPIPMARRRWDMTLADEVSGVGFNTTLKVD